MDRKSIESQLPDDIKKVLEKAMHYLNEARPGDIDHVFALLGEMIEINEKFSANLDFDILMPTAILHDIGHSAIMEEHFRLLTGTEKLKNSKLVHMLTGAKIAKKVLEEADYDKEKSKEIVELIAIHDGDQVEGMGLEVFDTDNKKWFHDFDRLEFFSKDRVLAKVNKDTSDEKIAKIKAIISKEVDRMFHEPFKKLAEDRYKEIETLIAEIKK